MSTFEFTQPKEYNVKEIFFQKNVQICGLETSYKTFVIFNECSVKKPDEACMLILTFLIYFDSFAIVQLVWLAFFKNLIFQQKLNLILNTKGPGTSFQAIFFTEFLDKSFFFLEYGIKVNKNNHKKTRIAKFTWSFTINIWARASLLFLKHGR